MTEHQNPERQIRERSDVRLCRAGCYARMPTWKLAPTAATMAIAACLRSQFVSLPANPRAYMSLHDISSQEARNRSGRSA
jgi:hypothetical protein